MTQTPSSSDIFDTQQGFDDLGLRESVLRGLKDAGFAQPTDIQARLIPLILDGRDALGQAKTGTGKTAAFALPILHMAEKATPGQALVLTPTRELASQVTAEINELAQHTPIRAVCIIGGESARQQSRDMKRGGHIVVGTPGRVMDLHGRQQLSFDAVRFVVLDEVDRMLDIGFRDDIRRILKSIRQARQTIFVSATIGQEIERLARSFMREDAEKIVTTSGSLTVAMVEQKYYSVEPWDKGTLLVQLLREEKPETVVIFCRTKATVHRVTKRLKDKGFNAREIHGDMHQNKRTQVMNTLREGKVDILVASDLAARGLDVEHITHVINYDLPDDPEIYIHRIGRTARAGRSGVAWSFVTPDQGQLLSEIEKLSGALIEPTRLEGFKPGPVPEDVREERERSKRPESDPMKRLVERAPGGVNTSELSEEQLKQMFPGGKVPKAAPKRTLGAKFATKRKR